MQYTGYSTYLGVKLTNIASGLTGATGLEKQIEDNFGDFTTKNNTYTTRNGEQDEYLSALETKAGNLETGATGLENRISELNNDYISIQNRQSALITGLTGTAGSTGLEERSTGFSNKIIAINNKLNGEIQEAINTKVADSIFNALTDEFGEAFEEFQTQLNQKVVTATQEALDARQDGDDAVLEKKFCSVEEFVQSFQQTYIIKKTDNSIYNFDGKIQKLDKAQPVFTIIEYTQNPEVSSTWDLKIKMTDYGYNVMTGDLVVKKGDSNSGTIVNTLTKSDFDATTKLYTLSLLDSNSNGTLINGPYTFEYRTSTGKVVYDLTLDSITNESVSNNSIEILGDAVWGRWIGGSGSDSGNGISATTDAVYVTGYTNIALTQPASILANMGSKPSASAFDAFIIKYDLNGVAQWGRWIGGAGSDTGYGISATTDAVYVTGSADSSLTQPASILTEMGPKPSSTGNDAFIIKYDLNGVAQWGRWIGGAGSEYGYNISATTDTNGVSAVYVIGVADSSLTQPASILTEMGPKPSATGTDAFVIKYNSAGVAEWGRWIGGSGSDSGNGISATTDAVYVTGYTNIALTQPASILANMGSKPSASAFDAFIIKYDLNGVAQWGRWIGGAGSDTGYGISATTDAVYVTGSAGAVLTQPVSILTEMGPKPSSTGNDAFVIKYNSAGVAEWGRWIGGAGTDTVYGISTATDLKGVSAVYITGSAVGQLIQPASILMVMGTKPRTANNDAFVIKYNSDGTAVWGRWIGGAGSDYGYSISVGSDGAYIIGIAQSALTQPASILTEMGPKPSTTGNDAFVIKYI